MRDHYSGNARARKAQNDDIKRLQGILEDRGFKEEVNEAISDILPFMKKLTTMTHPRGMEKLAKMYAKKAIEPKYKGKPNLAADVLLATLWPLTTVWIMINHGNKSNEQ